MSKNVTSFINSVTSTNFSQTSSANNELRESTPAVVVNSGSPLFCGILAGPVHRHLLFQFDISSLLSGLEGNTLYSANLVMNCTVVPASPPLYGAIRRVRAGGDDHNVVDSANATWNSWGSGGKEWGTGGGDYTSDNQTYITFPTSTGEFSSSITGILQDAFDNSLATLYLLVMPTNSFEDSGESNSNTTTIRIAGNNTAYISVVYQTTHQQLLGKKIYSGPRYTLSDYLNDSFTGENPGNYGVKDDRNDAGGTNMINTRVDDPNSNSNMTVYGANHIESSTTRVTNPSVGSLDVTVSGNTVTNNDATPSVTNSGAIVTSTTDPASSTSTGARVTGKTLPTNTSTGVKIVNT